MIRLLPFFFVLMIFSAALAISAGSPDKVAEQFAGVLESWNRPEAPGVAWGIYDILIRNNSLVINHSRHGAIGLIATAADTFTGDQWWLGRITFKRDQREGVTGFQVTGSRIRPVVFSKKVL